MIGEMAGATLVKEEPVFTHPRFNILNRLIVEENGSRRNQFVWDRRESSFVVVAAFTSDWNLLLVEEPKYGVMRRILNLPAGGIDGNETPEEAGARELLEETGYSAGETILLRRGIIDFADRIAGGEHSFVLATGVTHIAEPEELRVPVLISAEEARSLFLGNQSFPVVTAVSLSCLAAAMVHLGL